MRMPMAGLWVVLTLLTGLTGQVPYTHAETLTLEQALERVLERSPRLEAARLAIAADTERAAQAAAGLNPQLEMEWENLAGTGELSGLDASELTVTAAQTFELGGKRERRGEAALAARQLTEWDRAELRLDLAAQTRRAYVDAWVAQEAVRLATEQLELDRQLLAELGKRHEAGAASPIDLNRARVLAAGSGIGLNAARRGTETAYRRLAVLWGDLLPDFDAVQNRFEPVPDPAAAPLPRDWRTHNPQLARRHAERAAFQAEQALARAVGKPDLELGAGVRREQATGDVAFVLAAGLPLTLRDRNRAEQRAWQHEIERSDRLAEADALEIEAALEAAILERRNAFDELAVLREEILPQAAAAHESTREGHLRGLFSLTDVLETRRTLLELHRTRLDAVARYHYCQIRIDRLTGLDPFPAASASQEEIR